MYVFVSISQPHRRNR